MRANARNFARSGVSSFAMSSQPSIIPLSRGVGTGDRAAANAVVHVDAAEHPLLAVENIAAEDLDFLRRESESRAPQQHGELRAVIREAHSIPAVVELCAVLMEAHVGLDALFRRNADFIGDGFERLRAEFGVADQAGPRRGDLREPDQVLPGGADRRAFEDFRPAFICSGESSGSITKSTCSICSGTPIWL